MSSVWLTTAERQFCNSWTEHNRSLNSISQTWPSTCYFLSVSLKLLADSPTSPKSRSLS